MNRRTTTKTHARTRDVNSTYAPAYAMTRHPHTPSAWAHQAGFTIVEVMVAVVVFAVGLLAIAGMQTQSISQSTVSDQMSMRINAITHQAETLLGLPVLTDPKKNITVNPIFEQANMCKYGGESCNLTEIENDDKKPYTVSRRVTLGYPLEFLAMVELEVAPKNVNAGKTEQRTVRIAYVRSLRWN